MTDSNLVDSLPSPIGFVLGGGGSLGAQQVGMLQALTDRGVHCELVVGTSIGSVNGAVMAADPTGGASRLSHLWQAIDPDELMGRGFWRRIRSLIRSRDSLYERPEIAELLEVELGDVDIAELAIPYAAMAVDVATGMPARLTSGRLGTAVQASTAIPGVFPSVKRNGRTLYDGGLVTNVAVLDALEMGARSLVVLDCMFPSHQLTPPTTLVETALWTVTTQLRQQVLRDVPVAAEEVPVLYLPGPRPLMVSPLDFNHTAALMHDAYEAARVFLDTVSVDGAGLYQREPQNEGADQTVPDPAGGHDR